MRFIGYDLNATDGSDPAKVDKVYSDGTRIPLTDTAAIAAKDQEVQDYAADAQALTTQVQTVLNQIAARRTQIAADLTVASNASAATLKQVRDRQLNAEDQLLVTLERMIKALRRLV